MKVRNSSFEEGNTNFWEAEIGSDFTVDDSKASVGSYSGKITTNADGKFLIAHKDYIPVNENSVISASIDVYPDKDGVERLYIYYYDRDGNQLDYAFFGKGITGGQWNTIEFEDVIPKGCVYVKVKVYGLLLTANTEEWIDNLLVDVLTPDKQITRAKKLYDSGASSVTSSGDSSGDPKYLIGFNKYYAHLYADWDGADSDETLEVEIHDKAPETNDDVCVGAFTKVTAEDANERIELSKVSGRLMYAKWTLGGTTPSWKNLRVVVWGVR